MENDAVLWLMVGLVYIMTVFAAYQVGRALEARTWKAEIPGQMAKLCNECRGL